MSMRNALTFDIEEYFHAEAFARTVRPEEWPGLASRVVDTTERLLDILDYADAHATFFVLGWVAERYPALVQDIASRGHEVACHGYGHQMIHRQTRLEFAKDVQRAKTAIEDAAGTAVVGFRAPIFPIVHDLYGIPNAQRFPHRVPVMNGHGIAEFPMSTILVMGRRLPVAGGGYLRLMPYPMTRRAIHHLNKFEKQPAIVYLHPWEIDAHQPKVRVGLMTRIRHKIKTGSTEVKLHRLLKDFRFGPARDVLENAGVLNAGEAH